MQDLKLGFMSKLNSLKGFVARLWAQSTLGLLKKVQILLQIWKNGVFGILKKTIAEVLADGFLSRSLGRFVKLWKAVILPRALEENEVSE